MDSIPHTQFPTINQDAVKVEGRQWDRGVIHRAIVIARELCKAGIWNGQDVITIYDPPATFNRIFGFADQPITSLRSGVDYLIHEPVTLHDVRPELKPEPDGDILWA